MQNDCACQVRDELGHKCILSKAIDKCLEIHPMSEWERFMKSSANCLLLIQRPGSLRDTSLPARWNVRLINRENDSSTGTSGVRGIEKELVTVGAYEKIEVWSKEEWNSNENAAELDPSQLAESMMNYDF